MSFVVKEKLNRVLQHYGLQAVLSVDETTDVVMQRARQEMSETIQESLGLNDDPLTKAACEEVNAKLLAISIPLTAGEINARIETLRAEIGSWSQANFGDQSSKTEPGIVLGPMASLTGIFEEIGELYQAAGDSEVISPEHIDAMADILIYACDFSYRSGCPIAISQSAYVNTLRESLFHQSGLLANVTNPMKSLVIAAGQLAHVNLKHHQGIRGFDDRWKYSMTTERRLADLLLALIGCTCGRVIAFTEETWAKVKQRNWAKNRTNAHEVAEQANG